MNGGFLIFMVMMLVVMYVLLIRPQRNRQNMQQRMIDGAGVGDDILTTGGIYGTITRVEDEDIVVEIADGLNVHMTRRGIAAVLPPEEEEGEEDEVDEEVEDEVSVTADEDAVRSDANVDVSAGERR